MNTITAEAYHRRIEQAVLEKGYGLDKADLSFRLGDAVSEGFGPNPSGRYAALGVDLPKVGRLDKSHAEFSLGYHDVVVLMGTTIEKARHFSYTLYQYSYEDERFGNVVTRSSIGDCFNHVTLETANGQDSRFGAPFVIVIGSCREDREAIASILADCIDEELLDGRGFINEYAIPYKFVSAPDTLNFVNRISYVGQSFEEDLPPRKVEALEQEYIESRPYRAFVARGPGEGRQGLPDRRYEELEHEVAETAEHLRSVLADGYTAVDTHELQVSPPPNLVRYLGLDMVCNSTDALYRSALVKGDLRAALWEIHRNRMKDKRRPRSDFNTMVIKLFHRFNLRSRDFLLCVGVNYTLLKRLAYFSHSAYDEKYKMALASISDTALRETTRNDEIYAFVVAPTEEVRREVEALLRGLKGSSYNVPVKVLSRGDEPFYFGGRLYVDLLTNQPPRDRDFVPGVVMLFEKERR